MKKFETEHLGTRVNSKESYTAWLERSLGEARKTASELEEKLKNSPFEQFKKSMDQFATEFVKLANTAGKQQRFPQGGLIPKANDELAKSLKPRTKVDVEGRAYKVPNSADAGHGAEQIILDEAHSLCTAKLGDRKPLRVVARKGTHLYDELKDVIRAVDKGVASSREIPALAGVCDGAACKITIKKRKIIIESLQEVS
jgi:hypothetical protein